jgi:RimJ/RimL family protein N-acetyltransferase
VVRHGAAPTLETARLRLRAHVVEDFEPIAVMSGDPSVMRHVTGPLPREDVWRRMMCGPGMWALLGFGYWVVERRDDDELIGQIGLADFKRDMQPSIEGLPELGYIFAAAAHGQGYAGEAATAVLAWADAELGSDQIVAIINADNAPSIRLAERLGFLQREEASYKSEPILLFRRYAAAR